MTPPLAKPSVPSGAQAHIRFYAELNDFLPDERRQVTFPYRFRGRPAVKDAIEALGVPPPLAPSPSALRAVGKEPEDGGWLLA